MKSEALKSHLSRGSTWIRGLYMLLFAVLYGLAEIVLVAVAIFQFGTVLIAGRKNAQLLGFGAQLSRYMYQVLRFVTFTQDRKPYPFSEWPGGRRRSHQHHDSSKALPAGG